jgi:hypothetical protein
MSAFGQKRTFAARNGMSALPPRADMCSALAHVCFGPIADIGWLFDQLVCTAEQLPWYLEAKRLCGCEIDEELKVGRLYYR